MIEEAIIEMIKEVGFPIVISIILLYDRIKQNGSLKLVVENNNKLLKEIKKKL